MWTSLSKYCIVTEVKSLLGEVARRPYPPCLRWQKPIFRNYMNLWIYKYYLTVVYRFVTV